jgi:hypothetical protein
MLRFFALSLLLTIAVPVSRSDDGADNGHGQSLSGCDLGTNGRSLQGQARTDLGVGCARVNQATIDDDWQPYRGCHARAADLRLNDPTSCVGSTRSTRSRLIENTKG